MTPEFDSRVPETEIQKTETPNTEESGFPEIDNFLNDEKIKTNKEKIIKVLNKDGNKYLKEGLKSFILTEKNVIKVNACKHKLSQATDDNSIEDIIRRFIPEGYKIGDKIPEGKTEESEDKDNGNLENNLLQTQEEEKTEEEAKTEANLEEEKENDTIDLVRRIQLLSEAMDYRQQLSLSHADLEAKTGPGSDKYNQAKADLENLGILKQLKEDNHDDEFINNYIIVRATLQEIKDNPNYTKEEISTFDKMVKNLDNACKIPDTNLSSFNENNISQTRTELFDKEVGNESLRKTKESNMDSEAHQEKYKEMFPEMGNDEMLKKYGRFLQGDSKEFWIQYETNSETRNKVRDAQENPTEENRQLLESYNKMYKEILKIKEDYDTKTKDMVEDLCIISQIKGMYRCMGEGDNFTLNKAKEIESDKGILTLRGHIDGIDFAIRQDTTKASPLQTSSKLAKEKESTDDNNKNNNFVIGGTDKFVNSNYKLPSQDEIFSSITDTIMSDSSLDSVANQEEYFEDLQKKIMGNIDEKHNDTDLVHNYMREQVKGEKVIDKTIGLMKNIRGVDPESTVSSTSPKLYNFLNVMDHNVRYSTEAEKDRLNTIMEKINNMAESAKDNPSSGELANHEDKFGKYLTGESFINTKNILDGKPVQGSTAFDLFENYKLDSDTRNNGELYMINVEQLYNDLKIAENNKEENEKRSNDPTIAMVEGWGNENESSENDVPEISSNTMD